jgi:L-ascorbate oxidase
MVPEEAERMATSRIITSGNRSSLIGAAFIAGILVNTVPAWSGNYSLTVDPVEIDTGDFIRKGIGFNGSSPGPVLRFKEGEEVTINVTNNLDEPTSIHWHGLILPYDQDGVPTISFDGIQPGETFTYNFPIVQAGTYWFHSHSGFQEPDGAYGSIIIEPENREPFRYDREYVVQLADAHPHTGDRIMRNLKMMPDYYNRQQQTVGDFLSDTRRDGLSSALADRLAWGGMRMMKTDIEDLQGFTALINGHSPNQNWTGIFRSGERIRLRFINSSAMTYFDVRIPGLRMTVVNADGNNVQPVTVDAFRIAVAETYDVIVHPREDRAYTVFAESMGRSAYARGTLAPRKGMVGEIPEPGSSPLLTMADMGMNHGMDHGSASEDKAPDSSADSGQTGMPAHHADHQMKSQPPTDGHGMHGGHSQKNRDKTSSDPFYAQGSGLVPESGPGFKFLSYADLKAQKPLYPLREATREIELRLTGNMERYIWSINGKKYGEEEEIRLTYGERVRFRFVNETMMTHPMHLHGMWSILDVGAGKWNPIKHVVSVAPGTTVYMETEVDAPGQWAFHCHLSYHAASGMFRRVVVEGGPTGDDSRGSIGG